MWTIQKNFIYNIIYQLLLILLPLVTAPYISRTLGADGVGVYSYTYSVAYYFLLIAMLGIGNQGNRSVAAVRDNPNKLNHTFSAIYSLQFITFLIAILLYIAYMVFFDIDNKLIVFLQLFYVISGLLDVSWLFFGLEKFKITVSRNIIIKFVTVLCMFIFVHKPTDLWKYTLIMSVGTLLSQAYLWVFVRKNVKFIWVGFKDVFTNLKPVIILFIPVLAYSIYKVMDKIMLGNMATYAQVGFYNNAEKITNIPMGIITALGTVMLPRMSNIIAKGEVEKTEKYIRVSFKLVTLLSAAIAFGLIGVSEVLAPVFFGEDFALCSTIMQLLAVTVFFIAWANVIRTQYLIPNHYDKVYVISTITGAVLNFIINWFLIPEYQANGAAIGTIAAEFSVMLVQIIAVKNRLPVIKYIFSYTGILLIGVAMMIIVDIIGKVMGISLLTLTIQILVGGAFFTVAALIYMLLSKDELGQMLISVIRRKK